MSENSGPGLLPGGEPRPVADIDEALFDQLRPLHRIRWITLTAYAGLVTVALVVLALLYLSQGNAIKASCGFWAALAPLPATAPQGSDRPTRTSVIIIGTARESFAGQHCGQLPPPGAGLVRWGAYYHVKIRQ